MTSILKTDEIQSQNGGAVVKMQTLKHPSASGNNLVLESDGSATINQISSSSVFPSGHILQVVDATLSNVEANEQARTAETVVATAENQLTITSGNKVLVCAQVTLKAVASTNALAHARIREGTDTTGTIISEIAFMDNNTSSVFHTPHSLIALDDSPASTTPDYTLTMLRGSGGTSSVQLYNNASHFLKIILMEIKG